MKNDRHVAFWWASIAGVLAGISLWAPTEDFLHHTHNGNTYLFFSATAIILLYLCYKAEGSTGEAFFKKEAKDTEEYRLGQSSSGFSGMMYTPRAAVKSFMITFTAFVSLHVYSIYYFPDHQGVVVLAVIFYFLPLFVYNMHKNLPDATTLCVMSF